MQQLPDPRRPRQLAQPSDSRITSRADVAIGAKVREPGIGQVDAYILDLSLSGFRMQCHTRLTGERPIFMTLPGFTAFESKVCWRNGDLYGCEFQHALHPAVFDHIVSKFPLLASN